MQDDTTIVHAGRNPERHDGIVNPPVYHASTVLYPTMEAYLRRSEGDRRYRSVRYGASGTATTFALAAVTMALTAFLRHGDHILIVDSVYGPSRAFCDTMLARFGVDTTYYEPRLGADIATLMQPTTRLVFLVTPSYPARMRTAVPWTEPGFVLRYHVGLEDPDDLIADLDDGFTRLQQAIEAYR